VYHYFFIIKTNYYLYYILNVDSLFIVECHLITFYSHNRQLFLLQGIII